MFQKEIMTRTTITLGVSKMEWARSNIRNLSVWVEEKINQEIESKKAKTEMNDLIECRNCGIELGVYSLAIKLDGKCPKCGKKVI